MVAYYTGIPNLPTYTSVTGRPLIDYYTTTDGHVGYVYDLYGNSYTDEYVEYVYYVRDNYGWTIYDVQYPDSYTTICTMVKNNVAILLVGDYWYGEVTVYYKPTTTVAPTGVTLDKTWVSLDIGKTVALTATVSPSNATDKTVTWSSSNTSIATVSSSGVVTAKAEGSAVITAKTSNGKTATCSVKVISSTAAPTGVTLSASSKTLYVGNKFALAANVQPTNATSREVTWTSSNSNIASVAADGTVTAKAAGSATITAKTTNGKTATCSFTVKALTAANYPDTQIPTFTSVTGLNPTGSGPVIQDANLTAYIYNLDMDAYVNYISYLTTNAGWKITGEKTGDYFDYSLTLTKGTTSVDVIAVFDFDTINVQFASSGVPVTSVTFDTTWKSIGVGETFTLNATVLPANATNKTLTWTSSDTSVATVSSTGVVTAKGEGSAQIKATASSGKVATCSVKVTPAAVYPTDITLDTTWKALTVGSTFTLKATVLPANATNKTVTWTSSNTSIATVSTNGVVTAKKEGSAVITAKTSNGLTAKCSVKVTAATVAPTGVTLDTTWKALSVGSTFTLKATVSPSNATNKTVTWSSSNTSIATVSSSGVVTAKAEGSAQITAKTSNGLTAKCSVKVTAATVNPTSITLDTTWKALSVGSSFTLNATVAPSNATNKTVTWTSSNTSIATVSSTGVVTAKAEGSVQITAKTSNGLTAKCSVKVTAPADVPVTAITIWVPVVVGSTLSLTASLTPTNATNKAVTWTSSNTSVATVSSNGVVTAKKTGETIITVTSANGKKTTCGIKVIAR